jgi:hypothetical protein
MTLSANQYCYARAALFRRTLASALALSWYRGATFCSEPQAPQDIQCRVAARKLEFSVIGKMIGNAIRDSHDFFRRQRVLVVPKHEVGCAFAATRGLDSLTGRTNMFRSNRLPIQSHMTLLAMI